MTSSSVSGRLLVAFVVYPNEMSHRGVVRSFTAFRIDARIILGALYFCSTVSTHRNFDATLNYC